MPAPTQQEPWLRGPIPGIDPLFQPVAHSFIQALEDMPASLKGLSHEDLWKRNGRSASIGYHLVHATGGLDRLMTYARGEALSALQLSVLESEKKTEERRPHVAELLEAFEATVNRALEQLRVTPGDSALTVRYVGRARLPSTTLGVLFQAAEHTARHVGQVRTLVRILAQS